MNRKDGTNQFDRREMKRIQRHPQDKGNEKFPNLIGRTVHGFKVTFEDGEQVVHMDGLLTLNTELIRKHGKIKKAEAI